jgi:hypothetical protein
MARPHNPLEELILKYTRTYGIVFLIVGAGIMFWLIVLPLQQAEVGVPEIWISRKGILVGETFLILGMPCLAFGSRFLRMIPLSTDQPKTPAFYFIMTIIAIISIVTDNVMQTFLESKGYKFR